MIASGRFTHSDDQVTAEGARKFNYKLLGDSGDDPGLDFSR